MDKKQVQASLDLFQDLRKARVHLRDEDFAKYFHDLLAESAIREAFHLANILEENGATTTANKIREIYKPIAEGNIFTKGKYNGEQKY